MKKQLSMTTVIVISVVVAAVGFFGGMQFQKMQRVRMMGQFGDVSGQARFGQAGQNRMMSGSNRPIVGEITSNDETSLTVKMMDGSSRIVILSNGTAINKQATGVKSDLKTGERVLVIGTANSDGSVTATNIQLNPMGRGMMPGGSATPSSK